jgi:hypothetical protein
MRACVDEKESVVLHGQHPAFIFYFGIIVGFDKRYSGTVACSKQIGTCKQVEKVGRYRLHQKYVLLLSMKM